MGCFSQGPSRVRALPVAAGTNEGGHYFRYFCQAQPKLQVKQSLKAELALILFPPAPARPAAHPSGIVLKKLEVNKLSFVTILIVVL